jgi:hypothetical protein
MTNTTLKREYSFFKANAGYRVGHSAEGALRLARASLLLSELESQELVSIEWQHDDYADRGPIDWGGSEKEIAQWNRSVHEVEWCSIRNENGEILASLSGIWDADDRYRRVVEAELALECMEELEAIARTAEESEIETIG